MNRTLWILGFVVGCGGSATVDDPDGGTDRCPAPPVAVLENVRARSLEVVGEEILFINLDTGSPYYAGASKKGRSIERVRRDGTARTTIFEGPPGRYISDIHAIGTDLLFLETERDTGTGRDRTRLYRVPIAGGTPQFIVEHDPAGLSGILEEIIGDDGVNLYAVRARQSDASIWRIVLSDGTETELYRGPVSSRPHLHAGDLYFTSGKFPVAGQSGVYGLGKVPTTAASTEPIRVGTAACSGDVATGSFGTLCAGATETRKESVLSRYDTSGGAHAVLYTLITGTNRDVYFGVIDESSVFVSGDNSATQTTDLVRVPLAGGEPVVIACERRKLHRRGDFESGGSNSALEAQLDMRVMGSDLLWIETHKDPTEVSGIYRAAREP